MMMINIVKRVTTIQSDTLLSCNSDSTPGKAIERRTEPKLEPGGQLGEPTAPTVTPALPSLPHSESDDEDFEEVHEPERAPAEEAEDEADPEPELEENEEVVPLPSTPTSPANEVTLHRHGTMCLSGDGIAAEEFSGVSKPGESTVRPGCVPE
jgi:hypothetical protein